LRGGRKKEHVRRGRQEGAVGGRTRGGVGPWNRYTSIKEEGWVSGWVKGEKCEIKTTREILPEREGQRVFTLIQLLSFSTPTS